MVATLEGVFGVLNDVAFFQVALPFLFTFAIVYGILEEIDLFGDADRVNAIVAAAAGLFVSRFALTAGFDLPLLMSNYLGALSVVFLFIMSALVVSGLIGYTGNDQLYKKAFMYLGVIAGLGLFVAWGGLRVMFPDTAVNTAFLSSTSFVTLLVVLVALGAIGYIGGFIGEGDGDSGGSDLSNVSDEQLMQEAQRRQGG